MSIESILNILQSRFELTASWNWTWHDDSFSNVSSLMCLNKVHQLIDLLLSDITNSPNICWLATLEVKLLCIIICNRIHRQGSIGYLADAHLQNFNPCFESVILVCANLFSHILTKPNILVCIEHTTCHEWILIKSFEFFFVILQFLRFKNSCGVVLIIDVICITCFRHVYTAIKCIFIFLTLFIVKRAFKQFNITQELLITSVKLLQ